MSISLAGNSLQCALGWYRFWPAKCREHLVSGLILLERPIKSGDWVSVGSTEGHVKKIRIRSTLIQNLDAPMLLSQIRNSSQPKLRTGCFGKLVGSRLQLVWPMAVIQLVKKLCWRWRRTQDVLKSPSGHQPTVTFQDFGASSSILAYGSSSQILSAASSWPATLLCDRCHLSGKTTSRFHFPNATSISAASARSIPSWLNPKRNENSARPPFPWPDQILDFDRYYVYVPFIILNTVILIDRGHIFINYSSQAISN